MKKFIRTLFPPHRRLSLIIILILVLAIPFTVYQAMQRQKISQNAQAPTPTPMAHNNEANFKAVTMQLIALNKQYSQAASDGSLLNRLSDLASQRRHILLELIKNDPETALRSSFSQELKNNFAPQVQNQIEENVELSGTIEHLISDDFVNNNSKHYFYLDTANEKFTLHFAGELPEDVITGTGVAVKGLRVGEDVALRVQDLSVTQPKVLAASTSVVKKIAVILISFTNTTSLPFTPDFVRDAVFSGAASSNNLYKESSFGTFQLQGSIRPDGDVFGWYSIPYTNEGCDTYDWQTAAAIEAGKDGFNERNYTNIVYVFSSSGCTWSGLGTMGGTNSWINSSASNLGRNVAHELGHNYNLHHATTIHCTDNNGVKVAMSSNCTRAEYGDVYDVMGSYSRHFNNYHKGQMNWFNNSNTYTLTQSSGTHTLTLVPLEAASTGYQAIRIPKGDAFYYLEYRQPFGQSFDNFAPTDNVVNGVSIRIASDYRSIVKSQLIDNVPSSPDAFDSALLVNRTFYDPILGLSIKTLSISPTNATVEVSYGQVVCDHLNPTVSISPLNLWGNPGQNLSYTMSVTNNDTVGCSPSTFSFTSQLPGIGWTLTTNPTTLTLSPGSQANTTLTVTSPTGAVGGLYTFTEKVTNSQFPTFASSSVANYNVNPVTLPTPIPTAASTPTPTLLQPTLTPTRTPTPTPTRTPTPSPTSIPKRGDINGDSLVDIVDLSILLSNWELQVLLNPKADLDRDGIVSIIDLSMLLSNWGV